MVSRNYFSFEGRCVEMKKTPLSERYRKFLTLLKALENERKHLEKELENKRKKHSEEKTQWEKAIKTSKERLEALDLHYHDLQKEGYEIRLALERLKEVQTKSEQLLQEIFENLSLQDTEQNSQHILEEVIRIQEELKNLKEHRERLEKHIDGLLG